MKKVLVLEDEANIRGFIVINLRRAGYEVVEAESGEEALEKLKAQREEVAELQKVRRYVDVALKADTPQKAKSKHHDIDR